METSPPKPQRKQGATVPPKRGRIKAQIFESLAGTVSYVASKAGEKLNKIRLGGSTSDSSSSNSTAASPRLSAYGSDGFPA